MILFPGDEITTPLFCLAQYIKQEKVHLLHFDVEMFQKSRNNISAQMNSVQFGTRKQRNKWFFSRGKIFLKSFVAETLQIIGRQYIDLEITDVQAFDLLFMMPMYQQI